MQKWEDSKYWSSERMVEFDWQTDNGRGGWRVWYAMTTKPGSDMMNRVEDVNAFANFMRKLIRGTESETLNNATPGSIIVALEAMKAKYLVFDERDNGTKHFVEDVSDANMIAFNLREPDGEYVIERFFALDEEDARGQALILMAQRARGMTADHRRAVQLQMWTAEGMPMQKVYQNAPDTRPARERLNDGMNYFDGDDQVDDLGEPLEQDAVEEMVDAMESLWN